MSSSRFVKVNTASAQSYLVCYDSCVMASNGWGYTFYAMNATCRPIYAAGSNGRGNRGGYGLERS